MYQKPTVLIVDDVALNRALLTEILCEKYHIIEAADGYEALAVIGQKETEISIVMLDVVMPGMDGFTVLSQMREHGWIEHIPVVLISAENSNEYIARGYELGAIDYISRPFDAGIIQRRIANTIMLYAKQKALEALVAEQIREKEKSNMLMIDILSTIVEFRNGESGMHVLRIRVITEILLEELERRFPKYGLTPASTAMIANAASLHDIGKVAIPEHILNKPGRLTPEEYKEMQRHAELGAQMLEDMHFGRTEELVRYVREICRYHHERWDGGGYPEGRSGMEIPIGAQVVSIADVYDALVSQRVYKAAYSHRKAVRMILSGECGEFNPDLIECLLTVEAELERRIEKRCGNQDSLFNISRMSQELLLQNSIPTAPGTTAFLLEQEKAKRRFSAAVTEESWFEYDRDGDCLFFSEHAHDELGVPLVIEQVRLHWRDMVMISAADREDFGQKLSQATAKSPVLQMQYLLRMPGEAEQWYEFQVCTLWDKRRGNRFTGCVGKMRPIPARKAENERRCKGAENDPTTGLYNRIAAARRISSLLRQMPHQIAALLYIRVDDIGCANEVGQGGKLLRHIAAGLKSSVRTEDVAAHITGDTFMVFLKDVHSVDNAVQRGKQLRSTLCGCFEGIGCSVSVGAGIYPHSGVSFEILVQAATEALQTAQSTGKAGCCFHVGEEGLNVYK